MEVKDGDSVERFLGQLVEEACLSTEELQVNHSRETSTTKDRIPTAITALPTARVLVVGFDSGEIQTYYGLPPPVDDDVNVDGGLTPGPCFRIGDRSVLFLKPLENWNPFGHDAFGSGCHVNGSPMRESWSVFLAAASGAEDLFIFWMVNGKASLSRLRFELPREGKYNILDGVIAKGMDKVVAATQKGRLLLFPGTCEERQVSSGLVDERVVKKKIIKVAHEDKVTCLSTNESGSLLVSGGNDGKVCLWHWGQDQFLHLVGQTFLTNLPILAVRFNRGTNSQITVCIHTYVLSLKVVRKTMQTYILEQQPRLNVKLKGDGKISSLVQLENGNDFLVLRNSMLMEIVSSSAKEKFMPLNEKQAVLCIDQQQVNHDQGGSNVYTMAASLMAENQGPVIDVWWKKT